MPSTKKKSPSEAKKKSLVSTKAKTSIKKNTKTSKPVDVNDGSYLQGSEAMAHSSTHKGVSTVSNSAGNTVQEETSASMNQAILSMLHKIDASNQALTKRMDDLERQNTISSTPVASPTSQYPGASHITNIRQDKVNMSVAQASAGTSQAISVTCPSVMNSIPVAISSSARGMPSGARELSQVAKDSVATRLEVMRSNPSISTAVSQLLAHYDDQADQDAMPGKGPNYRKKSGRYNITDTSVVGPQFKWPNEGLISISHLKKPTYDDLNMAQWVSGQLNNVLLIEDNVTL